MAVNSPLPVAAELKPVAGIELGYAEAGIKKPNRKDVLVMKLAEGATVAGVFTKNRFCAAPVQVSKANLEAVKGGGKPIRALVVNTGNANAGTGEPGLQNAQATCAEVARLLGLDAQQVLPFSTGVILEPLPVQKIVAGLPAAISNLKADNWFNAAEAIMTTDTQPKAASLTTTIGGHAVTLTGISKGAGMIKPNMATMLGFLAIDAKVVLQELWLDTNLGAIMRDDQAWPRDVNDVVHAHRSEGDKPEHDGCDLAERGTPGLCLLFEIVAHCYRQSIDLDGAAAFAWPDSGPSGKTTSGRKVPSQSRYTYSAFSMVGEPRTQQMCRDIGNAPVNVTGSAGA